MKPRICGLATVFLRNTAGASAAFILVSFLSSVGSAESPAGLQARSAETPIERGSYLVNTIGACGNCHARNTAFNRTPDLAGGAEEDAEVGHIVMPNITSDPETGIGKWTDAEIVVALRDGKRPDGSIIGPPMPVPVYRQLSDNDAEAIAVYLLSLNPVKDALGRSQYKITLPPSYGAPITHVDEPVTTEKVAYGSYLVGFRALRAVPHAAWGRPAVQCEPRLFWFDLVIAPLANTLFGIGCDVAANARRDPTETWEFAPKQAITKAIRPDGTKLAGPMPYDWYAKMTPGDLDAIVAFMHTIKPIKGQDTTQVR